VILLLRTRMHYVPVDGTDRTDRDKDINETTPLHSTTTSEARSQLGDDTLDGRGILRKMDVSLDTKDERLED
jgi:hypothetical protein